jgi:DNA repair photolyase
VFGQFVYGDSERVFLNTTLGCRSSCSYCYLPSLDIPIGRRPISSATAREILRALEAEKSVVLGRNGTIFSIGCYSECWDSHARGETKRLIQSLLPLGNPVQFATKREVSEADIASFANQIKWRGQLTVFISCSTTSQWTKYEKGTAPPSRRFRAFRYQIALGIPCLLYIKPVIEGVTICDVNDFAAVLNAHRVDSVVGETLTTVTGGEPAMVGQGRLFAAPASGEIEIASALRARGFTVFGGSVAAVEKWRGSDNKGQGGGDG